MVNAIADSQKAAGKSGPNLYTLSFSIMIGLLLVALVGNELLKPVDEKCHEPTPSRERARAFEESTR
jgi:hypothetical protein